MPHRSPANAAAAVVEGSRVVSTKMGACEARERGLILSELESLSASSSSGFTGGGGLL